MKLPEKKKDKKKISTKRPTTASPAPEPAAPVVPAQPMMGGLRQDPPAQAVDLSGRAFNDAFPGISGRLAERRRQHQIRRELANRTSGDQADNAVIGPSGVTADEAPPATDKGEDS